MAASGDWRQLKITLDKENKYFTDTTQTVEWPNEIDYEYTLGHK